MKTTRLVRAVISALLVVCTVGCGNATVQVSGRVEFDDGAPLYTPMAAVRFEPTEDSPAESKKAAYSRLDQDGAFKLKRRKPGDGVFKGKYAVTFTAIKDPASRESIIAEQYTRAATTPYTVEVTGNKDDFVFTVERP